MKIAIGIDVAKEKSDVIAISEYGEILFGPKTIRHDQEGIADLISEIKN